MNSEFTKEEKKLLRAKDPDDYIDKSLNCNISSGRKAYVTRHWLEKTRHTSNDLEYSRNRHPYWKAKKGEGSAERVLQRLNEHNYSKGVKVIWDEDVLKEFIIANKKDKKGKYINKDWELAQQFRCNIATIQHQRRKYNMAVKLISAKYGKITSKRLLDHIRLGEGTLRKMVNKHKL